MLHTVNVALKEAGHEVVAAATDMPGTPRAYEFEGIPVINTNLLRCVQELRVFKPDVVLTHHDNTVKAVGLARRVGGKSVFFVHNDFDINANMLRSRPDLVVFNTHWVKASLGYRGPSSVFHPPVWAHEHRATPGDKVTLVNLNEHKGSALFYALAERLPDVEFLGVVGGHGNQVIRRDLPNVEIQEQTSDMRRDVWSRTGTLLVPSVYESYGMVAVEALASGIPVVANPTPGLRESLGPAGLFIDRDDTNGYELAIRRLRDDPGFRSERSALSLDRSAQLDPTDELRRLVDEIELLGGL